MAARYRTATGNWSNAAQWNGGTLPTSADDCYCNGFTVTLDQDVTAISIRNDSLASPVIAAGGQVNITTLPVDGRTITANLICNSTTSLLQLTATANTLNIIGNGTRGNTGNGGNVLLLSNCAGTTVNLTGNWQAGTGGSSSNAIGVTGAAGNLYHTGVLTGTTAGYCLNFASTGARTVSLGTCAGAGAAIGAGTGAGHTVTVSNINVTVAGFSNQVCAFLSGIIAGATLNTSGDIPTGTCLAFTINPSAGSGAITVNVNGGNGDIYWPAAVGIVISYNAGVGVNCTVNCRDIYSFRTGSPNSTGIVAQNSGVANTLTVNARDIIPGTVSGGNFGAVYNGSNSGTVVLNLSGTNGAVGGGPGNLFQHCGAVNAGTGTFYLYGVARGGSSSNGSCPGFLNSSTGTAFVTKAVSNNYPNDSLLAGQFGTQQVAGGGFITLDSSEGGSGGWPATSGRHFVRAGSSGQVKMRESNAGVIKTFGANPTDYPVPANVRDGISYNSGALTGACKVPPAGSVALGVPVDATTGTAALNGVTLAEIEASTVLAMKAHVDAVPAAVRAAIATELARIDVATSSRLAAAGYTAPDNATIASTATAVAAMPASVRTNLAAELARIDVATSSRLSAAGYTAPDNATIAATATAVGNVPANVRTNLATELGRIDAAISSRLAAAGYTAPLDGAATQAQVVAALGVYDAATAADVATGVATLLADGVTTKTAIAGVKTDTALIPATL